MNQESAIGEKTMNRNNKTGNLVFAAMLAALTCVATMIIKIPSPLKGYLNLGDCVVLLSGWMLLPGYGFLAAGFGSALADIFSGYVMYAPATFLIKGVMALLAYKGYQKLHGKISDSTARIISGTLAEVMMVLGYFVFEGFLYGFGPSVINIPANAVQGIAGLILGCVLIKMFKRNPIHD